MDQKPIALAKRVIEDLKVTGDSNSRITESSGSIISVIAVVAVIASILLFFFLLLFRARRRKNTSTEIISGHQKPELPDSSSGRNQESESASTVNGTEINEINGTPVAELVGEYGSELEENRRSEVLTELPTREHERVELDGRTLLTSRGS